MPQADTAPQSEPPAIEARGLTKRFGDKVAVAGIDMVVPRGEIFAVLGPNGAGKSVTVRMLTTLLKPDGGTASIFGLDVTRQAAAVREQIALTGQFASVDEDMTGAENLELIARLFGERPRAARRRAEALLNDFGLTDAASKKAGLYSGGMRRRLDIAASLVRQPALLFLDEPTTGLDPASRSHVWRTIRDLTADGVTVLLTTQYLEEADQLANRIAVIDKGRVIAEGTSAELKRRFGGHVATIELADGGRTEDALSVLDRNDQHAKADGKRISLTLDDARQASSAIDALADVGIDVAEFAYGQPTLDEVFLKLTAERPDHSVPSPTNEI